MKKIYLFLSVFITLFSCQKETSKPSNIVNNTTDTTNEVSISGFDCLNVKIAGILIKDQVANNVSATINYSGGNGKSYLTKSHTSIGVTGLSATLIAGKLVEGEGELTYVISGTPTAVGTATFQITLGGKNCTINIKVDEVIKNPVGKYGQKITDIDGNIYSTVVIGNQQWIVENLRVTKYNDGTEIPNIIDKTLWSNLSTGSWSFYNNDSINSKKYGKLYNFYTINGNKQICPSGWHIPTILEWETLARYYTDGQGALKDIDNWNSPNLGATNLSLFTALPGGLRDGENGDFRGFGDLGCWWGNDGSVELQNFKVGMSFGGGSNFKYKQGYSIRCIKD